MKRKSHFSLIVNIVGIVGLTFSLNFRVDFSRFVTLSINVTVTTLLHLSMDASLEINNLEKVIKTFNEFKNLKLSIYYLIERSHDLSTTKEWR